MGCGYNCVSCQEQAIPFVLWSLKGEQHRGHHSHGFLSYDGNFHVERKLGLIPKIDEKYIQDSLTNLPGRIALGNVRYTTFGGSDKNSLRMGTQPIVTEKEDVKVGMVFNGGLVPTKEVVKDIKSVFPEFVQPNCDLEYITRKFVAERLKHRDVEESVKICMKEIEGAYSVVGLTKEGEMFNFRDPHGIRPACIGLDEERKICAASSETVGLDINNIPFHSEVNPGEIIFISSDGIEREQLVPSSKKAFCSFEFAYFSSGSSKFGDKYVFEARQDFGRNLAHEYSDIVKNLKSILSSPDSGDDAAYGLHEASGKPWDRRVRRHRFVTERAFILSPKERYDLLDKKIDVLGPLDDDVGIVDDSTVRGDTLKELIEKLRAKEAKKVHAFITFPKIIGFCPYGIDMATLGELVGTTRNEEEIAKFIGADSVNYQSLDGFVKATGFKKDDLCLGCLTGTYPTPTAQEIYNRAREEFENGNEDKSRRIVENLTLQG